MSSAPHQRRRLPAQRTGGTAGARRADTSTRVAAPTYTFLGAPWRPGLSWLIPWLCWGVIALAGYSYPYLALPWWAPYATGIATAVITISAWAGSTGAVTAHDRARLPVWHIGPRLWWVTNLAAGGIWLTGVTATGRSYTPPYAWAITIGALTCCLTYPRVRAAQRRHETWVHAEVAGLYTDPEPEIELIPEPDPEPTPEEILADKWESTFASAGVARLTFIAEKPGPAGPILHMRLPEDGSVSYEQIKAAAERFGRVIGYGMPDGLRPNAIRVQRAQNRHGNPINSEVYVYIDVEDILAEIIWLPDHHTPLSIYKAFPVGRFADGSTIYLNLATIHAMIVGMTRSGKSNLLHVLLYQVSRCVDVVIWGYDGKGGATFRLWLKPWLDGDIDPTTGKPLAHPIIDWPAVDRFEVERQFLAMGALARTRPLIRADRGDTSDKWRATPENPAILFFGDEIAESLGAHTGPAWASMANGATSSDLGRIATSVLTLGAGEQIHMLLSGQRGTVTMFGPGDGKAQIKGRIAFELAATGEASEVFQKSHEATLLLAVTANQPGAVVVEGFGYPEPQPGKIFLAGTDANLADRIRTAVIAHTPLRPGLDADSEAVVNQFGYDTRWTDPDRTWWLRGHKTPPKTLLRFAGTGTGAAIGSGPTPLTAPPSPAPVAGSPFAAAFAALEGGLPTGGTGPVDPPAPLDSDETETWDKIEKQYYAEQARTAVENALGGQPQPAADPGEPDGYRRFLEILDQSGSNGCTVTVMWHTLSQEGLAPRVRQTLYTWRDRAARDGHVVQPTAGRNAPMYSSRHLAG